MLGCAGMAGLARGLQDSYGVPVVNGVAAAVKQPEALSFLDSKRRFYPSPPKPFLAEMSRFSTERSWAR